MSVEIVCELIKKKPWPTSPMRDMVSCLNSSGFIWRGVATLFKGKWEKDEQLYFEKSPIGGEENYRDWTKRLPKDWLEKQNRALQVIDESLLGGKGGMMWFNADMNCTSLEEWPWDSSLIVRVEANSLNLNWSFHEGLARREKKGWELVLKIVKEFYLKLHPEVGFMDIDYRMPQVQITSEGLEFRSIAAVNFFGPVLTDRLGKQKLLSAPAQQIKPLPDGGLLVIASRPQDLDDAAIETLEKYLGIPGPEKRRSGHIPGVGEIVEKFADDKETLTRELEKRFNEYYQNR